MLKKIGLLLGVAVILLLAYAAFKSPEYVIVRNITINAAPEKIFPYLNNVKLADQWGPWRDIDPQSKMVFSELEEGVGAKSSWSEGKQLGVGSATIVEVVPNQKVAIKIEYTQPMVMVQNSEYLVEAGANGQSVVTWKVHGTNNFISKVMCIFVNVDKVVGSMFEQGLQKLKKLVEADA